MNVTLKLVLLGIVETLEEIALDPERFARLEASGAFRELAQLVERIEAIANGSVS